MTLITSSSELSHVTFLLAASEGAIVAVRSNVSPTAAVFVVSSRLTPVTFLTAFTVMLTFSSGMVNS